MSQGVDPELARRTSGLTIGMLLRQRARLHPDRVAIIDGARRFSYAAFNERVNRLSAALRALEFGRGDRVAILSENCAEYLELLFAAGKLGVIVCTLNWRLADRELLHCVTLTEPRATFVSPPHLETARRLGEPMGRLIALGTEYEELLGRGSGAEPEIAAEPEDGLVVIYTSGTTGLPKPIVHGHGGILLETIWTVIPLGMDTYGSRSLAVGGVALYYAAERIADLPVPAVQFPLVRAFAQRDAQRAHGRAGHVTVGRRPAGVVLVCAFPDGARRRPKGALALEHDRSPLASHVWSAYLVRVPGRGRPRKRTTRTGAARRRPLELRFSRVRPTRQRAPASSRPGRRRCGAGAASRGR